VCLAGERDHREPWHLLTIAGVASGDAFKFDQFASLCQEVTIAPSEPYGTVDLPPIWAQDRREGLWLHWDRKTTILQ
jgi:hypothetical protein